MEASSWVPVLMCDILLSEMAGESPCLKLFVAEVSPVGAGLWSSPETAWGRWRVGQTYVPHCNPANPLHSESL